MTHHTFSTRLPTNSLYLLGISQHRHKNTITIYNRTGTQLRICNL